jgi:hypothetical protein
MLAGFPCAAAGRPRATYAQVRDHWSMTTSSRHGCVGSHGRERREVDGGDFEVVDNDTVSSPSHAAEFGYDGEVVVDYAVSGDVVTFESSCPNHASTPVRMPAPGHCLIRVRSVGAR